MRDAGRPLPVHADVPDLFRPACAALFSVPMGGDRIFITRTWVSKPLGTATQASTPACWLTSASRLDAAQEVGESIRSILEWLGNESRDGRLSGAEVDAIIWTLKRRVRLLTLPEAMNILDDLGIPVYHSVDQDIEEVMTLPFTDQVGFAINKLIHYTPQVPNKC